MLGRGVAALLLLLALLAVGTGTAAGVTGRGRRSGTRKSSRSSTSGRSSGGSGVGGEGSILQALLDSQYSELVGLLDKASMLQELERRVSEGGITVLAPKNSYLEQHFDPELRAFLLRPGHVSVLQRVLKFHILPVRVEGAQWSNRSVATLAGDSVSLRSYGLRRFVDYSRVFSPNSIVRKDGVAHGVSGLLIPRRVALQFEAWKRGDKFAVQPAGSPEGAPSHSSSSSSSPATPYYGPALAPMPSFPAMGPGPALAPAPGPSQEVFSWNEEDETLQFITALQNYGGYNDMADLLVNYTSLGVELGKLVKAGYKLTILAPNDQAMQQLGPEHLNSPLERILYYHMLSEYQTEDSLYSMVRRLGKQSYSTLQHPLKLVATESDGTVQFGAGNNSAQIYDHDIYVDGHLSIQGISKVLIPPPPH